MKKATTAALVLGLLIGLTGCYGTKLVRGPVTTDENAREIEKVRVDQAKAEERLVRLEGLSEEQIQLLRELRAGFAAGQDEMMARLGALEGRFDESDNRVERVEGKIDRVRYRLGRAPAPEESEAGDTSASTVVIDPKPLFDAAYLDLIRGNYRVALDGFEAYLEAYPMSVLSDDARYWIGECYFAEGEPEEAAEHFRRVERDHLDSERTPAALLKLAACYSELGDAGEARKILTRIVDEFGGSVEAPLAKEKLKETD